MVFYRFSRFGRQRIHISLGGIERIEIENRGQDLFDLIGAYLGHEAVKHNGYKRAAGVFRRICGNRNGVSARTHANFNMLIPLLLFPGTAINFNDDAAIFDKHVGNLGAISGFGGRAALCQHEIQLLIVGGDHAIFDDQPLFSHREWLAYEDSFSVDHADHVEPGLL